ncbi:MAG: hypothetical protein JOY90_21795 [Bradyrhizobium sp.]|uniref:hypothetical protein n=1 Tax=Bradyrhizobium sp. TaxID=376 RepID=UPI001DFEC970|nr:hypothetical protein [Bradyrhizobium sp.]MBV9563051.1 hypothetical protein [Bradyrhizobium sp.]
MNCYEGYYKANSPARRLVTKSLPEGRVVKGGHNPARSQIRHRPAAPAPIDRKAAPTGPSRNGS